MDKLKWGCDEQKLNSWDGGNLSFEKDRAYGFSWPQRNYRCSFCKKEFKSAQALGGHMNVHRRDRARMRLSPSWDSMKNPNPNPNPNFSSSSSTWSPLSSPAANYKGFSYNYSSIGGVTESPSSGEEKVQNFEHSKKIDIKKVCREKGNENEGKMVELTRRKDARVWKANDQFVKLDLDMGLIQDSKEDLDLELRLGY